jgi:hypothetical protein
MNTGAEPPAAAAALATPQQGVEIISQVVVEQPPASSGTNAETVTNGQTSMSSGTAVPQQEPENIGRLAVEQLTGVPGVGQPAANAAMATTLQRVESVGQEVLGQLSTATTSSQPSIANQQTGSASTCVTQQPASMDQPHTGSQGSPSQSSRTTFTRQPDVLRLQQFLSNAGLQSPSITRIPTTFNTRISRASLPNNVRNLLNVSHFLCTFQSRRCDYE